MVRELKGLLLETRYDDYHHKVIVMTSMMSCNDVTSLLIGYLHSLKISPPPQKKEKETRFRAEKIVLKLYILEINI